MPPEEKQRAREQKKKAREQRAAEAHKLLEQFGQDMERRNKGLRDFWHPKEICAGVRRYLEETLSSLSDEQRDVIRVLCASNSVALNTALYDTASLSDEEIQSIAGSTYLFARNSELQRIIERETEAVTSNTPRS